MARPEVEWPIPVYATELRERVVVTYRAAPRALAGRLPAPLAPELVGGQALVSLCLSNGRCLKAIGGRVLTSEFHLAELVTPARWNGACRPALRGLHVLALSADRPGIPRLLDAALEFDAGLAPQDQAVGRGCYECRVGEPGSGGSLLLRVERPSSLDDEAGWPAGSLFGSHEAAETHLLHPECCFFPDRWGTVVRGVAVHMYARATTHVRIESLEDDFTPRRLGLRPGDLEPDHALFQKRCTHTWAFPPERIPIARPAMRPGACRGLAAA